MSSKPNKPKQPKKKGAKKAVRKELQMLETKTAALTSLEKTQLKALRQELQKLKLDKLKSTKMCPKAVALVKQTIAPQFVVGPPVRLPDLSQGPCAVCRSKTIVNVVPNTDATSIGAGNGGRFSIIINPNLGLLNTGPSSGSWIGGTSSFSQGPTSATVGASYRINNTLSLSCLAAQYDGAHTWIPQTAWNTGAWNFTRDSQGSTLIGDAGTGAAATWSAGYTGGISSHYRPTAVSVYFRCSESQMANGGDVAIASVPDRFLGTICPLEGPAATAVGTYRDPGCLLNWENLSDYPDAYSGNLRKGAYAWNKPVPQNTMAPSNSETGTTAFCQFPFIVVSGQASPDINGNYASHVGTIEINAIYEYKTTQQFIPQKFESFDACAMEQWLRACDALPSAMSNEDHERWINKVLRFLLGAGAAGITLATGGAAGPAIAAGLATLSASKTMF
jgi:hypothetical protein